MTTSTDCVMSSNSSAIVRSAIERAESRASVLNSLERSYGAVTQQKALKKHSSPAADRSSSNYGTKPVENIQSFIGDQRERTRKALLDSLQGKSIVLSNLKSQTDASKSAKRVKSALGRLTSQRASKSKLKRLSPAICDPMIAPQSDDLNTLNTLWCMYISNVLTGAQSEAQLQARLITAEMVGARVVVVESGTEKCKGKDKGLKGVISAVSKQCYYVAHEKMVIASSSSSSSDAATSSSSSSSSSVSPQAAVTSVLSTGGEETADAKKSIIDQNEENGEVVKIVKDVIWVNKVMVRRVLKSTSVLAVLLPVPTNKSKRKREDGSEGENEKGRICLLYGSTHMDYATQI